MDFERRNIELLFRWMPIECIDYNRFEKSERNDCFHVNKRCFLEYCHYVYPYLSGDERTQGYYLMEMQMRSRKRYPASVFQLVLNVAEKIITYNSNDLSCRYIHLLRWRQLSLHLGQDFFICAYLADYDILWNIRREKFNWNPVLFSDNINITSLLERGLAENHFHLKGSSHVFYVNWLSLMNYPFNKHTAFSQIKKTLHPRHSDWKKRGDYLYIQCIKAAFYRIYLFGVCYDDTHLQELIRPALEGNCQLYMSDLQRAIEWGQWKYGIKIHKIGCLDYALTPDIYDKLSNTKLFEGERRLLYLCYRKCFKNEFSEHVQQIFYLYLKCCIEFRSEIIQSNDTFGFDNFADYQSRKENFISNKSIYENMYLQLAISCELSRPYIHSLEMRITPGKTVKKFRDKVKLADSFVEKFPQGKERTHYVIHFPKKEEKCKSLFSPRNDGLRKELRKYAQIMIHTIELDGNLRDRIVGIDACASEFGCRPEVFGQAYRYLQKVPWQNNSNSQQCNHLAATYHAGEDFFDILDGIRAIDEVIHFCGFHRGNRIGHGLALGIDPVDYYKDRANTIALPKQVLLDNVVWAIHKANTMSYPLSPSLKEEFNTCFNMLVNEIFSLPNNLFEAVTVNEYYNSWLLRGDCPDVYLKSFPRFKEQIDYKRREINLWERFAINDLKGKDNIRGNKKIYWLNKMYNYNHKLRKIGDEVIEFRVKKSYIDLIYNIQEDMIRELSQMGIAIETNPSSNYLIGKIKRYDKHPILRFNSRKLEDTERNSTLSVSINTDDLGVFDTSLENEYALMALALEKAQDDSGKNKYDREDIYEWLDYVRKMGLVQKFRKY